MKLFRNAECELWNGPTLALVLALALDLLAVPRAAAAQPGGRVYRLGILRPTAPLSADVEALLPAALRELGYVEGQNLVVERRYAEGKIDRLPELARELVRLRVDVIVAVGIGAIRAAKEATTTIPIVMWGNFDPVKAGLVASLAHPLGNVTGVLIAPDGTLAAKKLQLLKEAVPRAIRIALLAPDDPSVGIQQQEQELRKAAASLSVELRVVVVQGSDYDRAFATIDAGQSQALFVGAHTFFFRDAKRIIALAAKHKLPAIYEWPEQAREGGLMAYGRSMPEGYQRLATYVDRTLKGAKPGDLPIEQPTKFELVLNLKTAKALGLTIPQSVLVRADEVIQ